MPSNYSFKDNCCWFIGWSRQSVTNTLIVFLHAVADDSVSCDMRWCEDMTRTSEARKKDWPGGRELPFSSDPHRFHRPLHHHTRSHTDPPHLPPGFHCSAHDKTHGLISLGRVVLCAHFRKENNWREWKLGEPNKKKKKTSPVSVCASDLFSWCAMNIISQPLNPNLQGGKSRTVLTLMMAATSTSHMSTAGPRQMPITSQLSTLIRGLPSAPGGCQH